MIPKQYLPIDGEPILARSIGAFARHPRIADCLVVIQPEDSELYRSAAAPFAGRLRPPVAGGQRRQDSVRAGLEALAAAPPERVLIHDAARPFVGSAVIDRVLDALESETAVLPALPLNDSLKRAQDGHVTASVDRASLWRAQTPQGFRYDAILAAHRAASASDRPEFTDDAGVAEWFGLDVVLVEGSEENVKLTTADDIAAAARLAAMKAGRGAGSLRVGTGYDVHAFGPGDAVMLCGVRIPHQKALIGHSDADVGLHALTDAILGAIAEGDIGVHFPPADARWRGAASEIFLEDAAARVRARGGSIDNVDVTFLCQAPRIGPHRDAMRTRLAAILRLDVAQVSVKATTNEGLGFIGRGEGIAALATATVRVP
jgi:2-C-methyl-D-erythritol 4-phosphate cytidylyltransferase/2-C-methyl-D-erythritol 2,4-cyclodiphosphate synthase